MQIREEKRSNAVILHLEGPAAEPGAAFEDALRRAIEDDSTDVIVDLSAADDFKAVRGLADAERLRRDLGGARRFAVVCGRDSDVRVALALSGFSKIAPIFDTVEDVLFSWETDGMPI